MEVFSSIKADEGRQFKTLVTKNFFLDEDFTNVPWTVNHTNSTRIMKFIAAVYTDILIFMSTIMNNDAEYSKQYQTSSLFIYKSTLSSVPYN